MMAAVGTKVKILDFGELVEVLGYEIRKDATYLIVENGKLESKINILNEGRIFEFVEQEHGNGRKTTKKETGIRRVVG